MHVKTAYVNIKSYNIISCIIFFPYKIKYNSRTETVFLTDQAAALLLLKCTFHLYKLSNLQIT